MPSEPSSPPRMKFTLEKPLVVSPLSTINDTATTVEPDPASSLPVGLAHAQSSESASETAAELPPDSSNVQSPQSSSPHRSAGAPGVEGMSSQRQPSEQAVAASPTRSAHQRTHLDLSAEGNLSIFNDFADTDAVHMVGESVSHGAAVQASGEVDHHDEVDEESAASAKVAARMFGDTSCGDPRTIDALSEELPVGVFFDRIRLKGVGFADETFDANIEIRDAIRALGSLLDGQPELEIKAAETEAELLEALKLYRDMNHLSLAGGITCEHVVGHVQSHTLLLYYRSSPEAAPIPVTAATFSMRQHSMMLRLLATHPRMTRKGFGRVTVHFLKELCRALYKTEIIVYTYPSSASFYKALHFMHTHPQRAETQRPALASADADERSREAARDARRVYSAKENEMIFHCQQTMEQILAQGYKSGQAGVLHPYACTRRRLGGIAEKSASYHTTEAEAAPETSRTRRPLSQTHAPSSAPVIPLPSARGTQRTSRGRRGRPSNVEIAQRQALAAQQQAAEQAAQQQVAQQQAQQQADERNAAQHPARPSRVADRRSCTSLKGSETSKLSWYSAVAPLLPRKGSTAEAPERPLNASNTNISQPESSGEGLCHGARDDQPGPRKRVKVGSSKYPFSRFF